MIPLGIDQVTIDTALPLFATVRTLRLAELTDQDRRQWARLSVQCSADSLFAADWFVRAVLTHFDPQGRQRLFVAVDAMGDWYGVAVLGARPWLGRVPLAHWAALANPNQFLGVPLVRRGRESAFWRALLTVLDTQSQGQAALCLNDMPADHRVTQALLAQCAKAGRSAQILARRNRAALTSSRELNVQMEQGLSSKRLSRLRSLERKLTREQGPVRCVRAATAAEIDSWIAHYLTLEAAGWKGRAGSALASSPDSMALFRDAVREGHARGSITCLSLVVADKIIAMSSFLVEGGHAFGFKCCFDEAYASYAPGILLLRRIMALVSDGPDLHFDSCSAPHETTINGLWHERREMLDVAIGLYAPFAEPRFGLAMAARRAWHAMKKSPTIALAAV